MNPLERFRSLTQVVRKPIPPPETPQPTEEDKLLADLRLFIHNEEVCNTFLRWLEILIPKAKLLHRSSLSNHPLMCHYDGQVAALESLRDTLVSLRREGASSPHTLR